MSLEQKFLDFKNQRGHWGEPEDDKRVVPDMFRLFFQVVPGLCIYAGKPAFRLLGILGSKVTQSINNLNLPQFDLRHW